MHYDALILGAGMSGLAAGIRLAHFGRRVAVLERHTLWGGLNSFYKLGGRRIDSGLHALTNFAPPGARGAPLTRILRQLRLRHEDLALAEQGFSTIVFTPGGARVELAFSNDPARLREEIAARFPACAAGFDRLVRELPGYEQAAGAGARSAREVLRGHLADPLLVEMLLAPACWYGSATPDDLPWGDFAVLFRSIFLEGFSLPEGGIKRLLDLLVRRLRESGGELRMGNGVRRIRVEGGSARGVVMDDGSELTCDQMLSSAGLFETLRLCDPSEALAPARGAPGELSFLETISVLDAPPAGHRAAITFFNEGERLVYARPRGREAPRSGVISCSSGYRWPGKPPEPHVRVTVLADPLEWATLEGGDYAREKARAVEQALDAAARAAFDPRPHTVFRDAFTPRTIERFTGHIHGAVYGAPEKRRDGATGLPNLHLIGTDTGLVGVVGALLSGISVANRRGLVASP